MKLRLLLAALLALAGIPVSLHAAAHTLDNGLVTAEFDDRGLTSLRVAGVPEGLALGGDSAALEVDGRALALPGLPLAGTQADGESPLLEVRSRYPELEVRDRRSPGREAGHPERARWQAHPKE